MLPSQISEWLTARAPAGCAARRLDADALTTVADMALERAEELGVEDDDDLRMVARAMGLLADGLAWSDHLEALSPEDGDAVCFGNDLCHDRRLDLVRRLPGPFFFRFFIQRHIAGRRPS